LYQYDGFTDPIQISLSVCACSTYHWKFIIADAGDHAYDSGIFLDYINSCNSPLAFNTTTTPSACGCNGTATVNITSGVPPYSYLWMPGGDTNQTATGLCPGIYQVSVYDAISCNTPLVQNVVITGHRTLSLAMYLMWLMYYVQVILQVPLPFLLRAATRLSLTYGVPILRK
jgi:hypothetical protein